MVSIYFLCFQTILPSELPSACVCILYIPIFSFPFQREGTI